MNLRRIKNEIEVRLIDLYLNITDKIGYATLYRDSYLIPVLNKLNEEYNIEKVYYPACGCHKLARNLFGADKVYHLSRELDAVDGYFKRLGEGHKIQGDVRGSPFKDNTFDATFWNLSTKVLSEAVPELHRVTKDEGLLIIDTYYRPEPFLLDIIRQLDDKAEKIDIMVPNYERIFNYDGQDWDIDGTPFDHENPPMIPCSDIGIHVYRNEFDL